MATVIQPTLLQGTLDVMILATLGRQPMHGYALAREIERVSRGTLIVEEGSLYPALSRLWRRGDLAGSWAITDQGRRAKVYRLTTQGRRGLASQVTLWNRVSNAVDRVVAGDGRSGRWRESLGE